MIVASFCAFLFAFILVGVASVWKKKSTKEDYLLAGQNIKPWLVALSAVATNNSGYMFIGMIGFTYAVGLSSIWMMIGWVFGDFVASLFVHKRLRVVTQKEGALTFSGALSRWNGTNFKYYRFLAGIVSVVFLGTYAAAQLSAGSKALHVLFGWDYSVGALIGAAMVTIYCFSGGIRASIWTDAAQSFVMIAAMVALCVSAVMKIGGLPEFWSGMQAVSDQYVSLFPNDLPFGAMAGPFIFVLGWVFAGFGVVGQPHIMVRFMAMDNPSNMGKVRAYYYSWYSAFFALTIFAGLAARLLLPDVASFDSELALPTLATQLLPEVFVGLVLAGLFSASMSTADSQVLSCSASITSDLTFGKKQSYWMTKITTLVVMFAVLLVSLFGDDSVFSLVLISWSALASAFAPILLVYTLGGKPNEKTAIAMLVCGMLSMLIWRFLDLHHAIYEVMPGILGGLLPYFVSRFIDLKNRVAAKTSV